MKLKKNHLYVLLVVALFVIGAIGVNSYERCSNKCSIPRQYCV